jgi:hypothetical protein
MMMRLFPNVAFSTASRIKRGILLVLIAVVALPAEVVALHSSSEQSQLKLHFPNVMERRNASCCCCCCCCCCCSSKDDDDDDDDDGRPSSTIVAEVTTPLSLVFAMIYDFTDSPPFPPSCGSLGLSVPHLTSKTRRDDRGRISP